MNWARWRSTEMWAEIYDRMAALVAGASHHAGVRQHAAAVRARGACIWASAWARTRCCRITEACRGACAWKPKQRLKSGELRAVVATASLELGIDIGTVDLVCQIGSPRSIAVALQRVGRAGHWVGAKPKGRFFATTRDELIECAALVRAIRARATGPAGNPDARRWIFWRSRSSPMAACDAIGTKTICSRWSAAHIPIAIWSGSEFDAWSRCFPKASRRRAGAAGRICIAIR